jgi:hypothetical protein
VHRALEKLHRYFARRGVSSTTAIIAGAISAHSVQAAPAALAKAATAAAITKGAAASGSTLTLIKGALKIMAWTKAKTAVVSGVVVLIAAGTITPIIIHHHRANASIFSQTKELSDSDNAKFVSLTGVTPEQGARTFLEACEQENWDEVGKSFSPEFRARHPSVFDQFKNYYGGMKIISMVKPFKKADYHGVYVPYEIQLKDGTVKKWNLAITYNNSERHWDWDGGM